MTKWYLTNVELSFQTRLYLISLQKYEQVQFDHHHRFHTTAPQSKQDRIPYKQSLPHQSCRHALSPTVILV